MNLKAYANIESLESVAAANGITVPRLRGYELMKDQQPVSDKDLRDNIEWYKVQVLKDGCRSRFRFGGSYWYCHKTDREIDRLLTHEEHAKIRWDRIHGKKRRALKFAIKKRIRCYKAQTAMWNKFCGQDVLYAHARIGGRNWSSYRDEVERQPNFICRANDSDDSTYCDLYFRLKNENKEEVTG